MMKPKLMTLRTLKTTSAIVKLEENVAMKPAAVSFQTIMFATM